MERTCQSQLLAEAAGTPISIRHESAKHTASQVGTPLAGWFSYQPIYDKVVERDPSFLN